MGLMKSLFGGGGGTGIPGWQKDFLTDIMGQGQTLQQGMQGQAQQFGQQAGQQLYGQGQQFLGGMGQNAGQQLNPFISGSSLQPQLQGLAEVGQQFLGRGLGQIGGGALQSGGFGGTRQGVAEGQAIGDATGQFMGAAGSLIGQDMFRRQSAAGQQAGLQAQSGLGALSQLNPMMNLGMSQFTSQFQPLMAQSQLVGNPIMQQGTQATGVVPAVGSFFS